MEGTPKKAKIYDPLGSFARRPLEELVNFVNRYWCQQFNNGFLGNERTLTCPEGFVELHNGVIQPHASHKKYVKDVDTLHITLGKIIGSHWRFIISLVYSKAGCVPFSVALRLIPLLLKHLAPEAEKKSMSTKAYPIYRMKKVPQQGYTGDCDNIMPFICLKHAGEILDEVPCEHAVALTALNLCGQLEEERGGHLITDTQPGPLGL